jgi:exonuclease VII large subunit
VKLSGIYARLKQYWADYPEQTVTGVVGELNLSRGGHVYFTLADGDELLRCMMYRGDWKKHKGSGVKEGDTATVVGRLEVYSRKGQLQLVVTRITTNTHGDDL